MYSPEIKAFIREKSSLFWSVPEDKKEEISPALMDEVSRIFFSAKGRQKLNYYPAIYHYFTLFFKKYSNVEPPEKVQELFPPLNHIRGD